MSATGVASADRPRWYSSSGLAVRGATILRMVALKPVGSRSRPGEIERLGLLTSDVFRGSRKSFILLELVGGEVSRLEITGRAVHGVPLPGVLVEDEENVGTVGDVVSRGNFGTGRGLRYLSCGFMVLVSDTAELVLAFRGRPLERLNGTCRTFTSCPGISGHDVVDGSAELWNSISSSNLY